MSMFDRIFIKKNDKGQLEMQQDGLSMGAMLNKAQGLKPAPIEARALPTQHEESKVIVDPDLMMEQRALHPTAADKNKVVMLNGGADTIKDAMLKKLDSAAGFASRRTRELQDMETAMPSLEDAAENEKEGVMRLDARSDVWSRIAGIFSRAAADQDAFHRLSRIKSELEGLRNHSLGKGPIGEIEKFQAIEEIEKEMRS